MLDLFLTNSRRGWGSSETALVVLPIPTLSICQRLCWGLEMKTSLRPVCKAPRAVFLVCITHHTFNSIAFLLPSTPQIAQCWNCADNANSFSFLSFRNSNKTKEVACAHLHSAIKSRNSISQISRIDNVIHENYNDDFGWVNLFFFFFNLTNTWK